MDDVYFLIPLGLVLGLAGLVAFLWTLRTGQYDDLKGASERILFDDDAEPLMVGPLKKDHYEHKEDGSGATR